MIELEVGSSFHTLPLVYVATPKNEFCHQKVLQYC